MSQGRKRGAERKALSHKLCLLMLLCVSSQCCSLLTQAGFSCLPARMKLHESTAVHCLMIPVWSVPELSKHLLHKYISKYFHCQLTGFKRGLCSRIWEKWAGRNTSDNQEGSKRKRSSKRNADLHRWHFLECKKKTLCDSKQFSDLNELAHIYYIYWARHQRSGWVRCNNDSEIKAAANDT